MPVTMPRTLTVVPLHAALAPSVWMLVIATKPFASAWQGCGPTAPEHVHILLNSKANWVPVDAQAGDQQFDEYPDQSLEEWHRAHGLLKKV